MIGLQKLVIKQNIKIIELAKELKCNPSNIYGWFKNNKIPKTRLKQLAEKFNVKEDYLNKVVNDISTYKPKQNGFCNEYVTKDNITKVILNRRKGKDFITLIDTEDLQKLKEFNHNWHSAYQKKVDGY